MGFVSLSKSSLSSLLKRLKTPQHRTCFSPCVCTASTTLRPGGATIAQIKMLTCRTEARDSGLFLIYKIETGPNWNHLSQPAQALCVCVWRGQVNMIQNQTHFRIYKTKIQPAHFSLNQSQKPPPTPTPHCRTVVCLCRVLQHSAVVG